jgi:hypothetical protein
MRECRLAQARWAGQEHMVQRLSAAQGRFHVDPQILLDLLLSDIFSQPRRANSQFKLAFFVIQ